jgi:hypothetical protein
MASKVRKGTVTDCAGGEMLRVYPLMWLKEMVATPMFRHQPPSRDG